MSDNEQIEAYESGGLAQASEGFLVTVVIPARNEEQSIQGCMDAVRHQTYHDLEILVVDGLSTDRTREIVGEIAKSDRRVRLVDNPERVTPAALNVGLVHAAGRFLIRIDAHAYADTDYVSRIVGHLATGKYAGVGGRKIAVGGRSAISRAIAAALSSRFGVGGSKYHYVSTPTLAEHIPFGAYETELLREVGGWDPRALVNQDFELDYRIRAAGGMLLLDPSIRVWWKSSQTLRSFAHQYWRYGTGKAIVARRHPRSLRVRHLLPVAGLTWIVGTCIVALATLNPIVLAAVAPYPAFLIAALFDSKSRPSGRSSWLWVPVALAVMHVSWGVGFAQEMARGVLFRRGPKDPFRPRDLSQAME